MNDIIKIGSILLIQKCDIVSINDKSLSKTIKLLKKTLNNIPDSAGIAANQIGINKQIIAYRNPKNRVDKNEESFNDIRILINPVIESTSNDLNLGWEGCLSIPNIKSVVSRYNSIHISGYDEEFIFQEIFASGFLSRNLQHEIDHLLGKTIFDRIYDSKFISHSNEMQNGICNKINSKINTYGKF